MMCTAFDIDADYSINQYDVLLFIASNAKRAAMYAVGQLATTGTNLKRLCRAALFPLSIIGMLQVKSG